MTGEVYPGNTGDPKPVPYQVDKLRERFGLQRMELVGDRGLLTETQIQNLKQHPGLGWISALGSQSIRALLAAGCLEHSLSDEVNLAEVGNRRRNTCSITADLPEATFTQLTDLTPSKQKPSAC